MQLRLKARVASAWLALRRALCALVGDGWRQALLRLALAGSFAGLVGFTVAWLGLIPIAASEGHWPITRWFLHFTMRNSVQTHALATEVPTLDSEALVLKGAGHYATGCAACHGAPGEDPSLVAQQMTPEAPYLPPKIETWNAAQLFWIVKHGIKYTAMPSWVSMKRDDEVWAMVAFLEQLPDMSPEHYRRLAFGELAGRTDSDNTPNNTPASNNTPDNTSNNLRQLLDPAGPVLDNCARCHGRQGLGRGTGAFPRLAGLSEEYLYASLKAYATGKRHSGIMQPVAVALDDKTLRALAGHYAGLPATEADLAPPDKPQAIARGRAIAERGIPKHGVPACDDCHGPGAEGRNPIYPSLAGQYADYLALQLSLFQSSSRGGTPYAHIMRQVAKPLTKEQIRDLSLFYASLPPEEAPDTKP